MKCLNGLRSGLTRTAFSLLLVVGACAGTLDAADPMERVAAIEALAADAAAARFDRLASLLQHDPDGQVRMAAAMALSRSGDHRAVSLLVKQLQRDRRERTGVWAALIPALGEAGSAEALPILIESLNDRDDFWLGREMAARALGLIGDKRAVPALISAAWAVDTRTDAIVALARMRDTRALFELISALAADEEPEARQAAFEGLADLGEAAQAELLGTLLELSWADRQVGQRRKLCQLLTALEAESFKEAMRSVRCDADPETRRCIQEIAGKAECP